MRSLRHKVSEITNAGEPVVWHQPHGAPNMRLRVLTWPEVPRASWTISD